MKIIVVDDTQKPIANAAEACEAVDSSRRLLFSWQNANTSAALNIGRIQLIHNKYDETKSKIVAFSLNKKRFYNMVCDLFANSNDTTLSHGERFGEILWKQWKENSVLHRIDGPALCIYEPNLINNAWDKIEKEVWYHKGTQLPGFTLEIAKNPSLVLAYAMERPFLLEAVKNLSTDNGWVPANAWPALQLTINEDQ